MCDIAPFYTECIYDDYCHDLICCRYSHLSFAVHELTAAIPIIGKHIPTYECPMFEIKSKDICYTCGAKMDEEYRQ